MVDAQRALSEVLDNCSLQQMRQMGDSGADRLISKEECASRAKLSRR